MLGSEFDDDAGLKIGKRDWILFFFLYILLLNVEMTLEHEL